MRSGLIALSTALAFVLTSCGGAGFPRLEVSAFSEKTFEAVVPLCIDIDCENGSMEVYSWNKKAVKLEITRRVRGREAEASLLKRLDDFKLDMAAEDDEFHLKSRFKGGGHAEGTVDFKLYIPKKTASFKLGQKSGRLVFFDDFNGDMEVSAENLELVVNRLEGKLTCRLGGGDLRVSAGILEDGSGARLEKGNIKISAAFEEPGSYDFKTGFGVLELDLPAGANAVFDTYGFLEASDFEKGDNPSRFRLESKIGKINVQKF